MIHYYWRKVVGVGTSLGLIIPKELEKSVGLEKGQKITIMTNVIEDVDNFIIIDLQGRSREELWKILRGR